MSKEVKIRYFALFREQRGISSESRKTEALTLAELYAELKEEFGFTLAAGHLQVARNAELADWDAVLNAGDEIVFIPPTAGG